MKASERSEFIQEFLAEYSFPVLVDKGTEYSQGQEDSNSNFKRQSEELGLTPEQVLKVYLNKHLDAISYAIKTGKFFEGSEPFYGRIGDAINYLLILASLVKEREDIGKPTDVAVALGLDADEAPDREHFRLEHEGRVPPAPEDRLPMKGSCI